MAEGTPDQDIRIKFSVDAEAALARWAEIESTTEKYKAELQALANEGGKSILTLAEAMKQLYAETTRAAATKKAEPLMAGGPVEKAEASRILAEAEASITEYNKRISEAVQRALADVNAATKQSTNDRIAEEKRFTDQQKISIKQQEDNRKQQLAQEKANLKASEDAQKEYVNAWKSGIPVMSAGAKAFGDQVQATKTQIQQIATQTGQSFAQVGQQLVSGGANIKLVTQAIRELNTTASATPSIFSRIGGAIQVALGIGLEQIVMKTVRAIINGFKQITEAGFEYAQSLIKLQIGTQLLQRAGLNITMKETLDLVTQLNKEFPLFTRKSIVEGIGYMQILSQNLGLSADQMKNLSNVSAALAVILGKDVGEATKEIALFLSSGYGEALQRAGILASKASVEHELLAMGITEGYNSVDQATRAQAGYNVIMQQASTLVEKAKDAQGNYAYSLRQTQTAWQNLINSLGSKAAPAISVFSKALQAVINQLDSFLSHVSQVFYYLSLNISNITLKLMLLWKTFGPNATLAAKDFKKSWDAITAEVFKGLDEIEKAFAEDKGIAEAINKYGGDLQKAAAGFALGDVYQNLKDDAIGAGTAAEEAAAKISQAMKDLEDKILDDQKNFDTESASLWTDYQRDIEKINRDGLFRQEALFTDFIRAIEQIEAKLAEDIYNENLKYEASVADTMRDYASKREDAENKYRERELKAQKDFEEKMRRLREDFIMDMEDALRERDARQVLRLIRQFNLNQDRIKREAESEKEDRQRAYREELKDLEKQRDERLADLAREHAARVAAIQRQAQIERQQAWQKYQQELADLQRSLENQKIERDLRYKQQMDDLKLQQDARLKSILDALVTEYNLTGPMLEQIMGLYRSKYGVGGELEQIYNYAAQLIKGLNDMLAYAAKAAAGGWGTSGPLPTGQTGKTTSGPGGTKPGYATGGSFLATSPMIAKFGEVPEIITITPVNQTRQTPISSRSKDKNGKLAIDLFLSPDLEARIVDKTLDTNAEVMLNVQRRR